MYVFKVKSKSKRLFPPLKEERTQNLPLLIIKYWCDFFCRLYHPVKKHLRYRRIILARTRKENIHVLTVVENISINTCMGYTLRGISEITDNIHASFIFSSSFIIFQIPFE